jgi:uncharacterized protein (TIGR00369 family)
MNIDPVTLLMRGREVLAEQPFSRLLGAELKRLEPGGICELELALRTDLLQQRGFVHGGVVSYLADNALTYAGGAAAGFAVVTSEFKINYVRPAIGERLIARAEAVSVGKNQVVCRCDVFVRSGADEKLCAVAQGTIARVSEG